MAGQDDSVWKAITARLKQLGQSGAHVRVGILASKGGTELAADGELTLMEIAAIHEFGSEAANIRERSFIRFTCEQKKDEIVRLQARVAKAFLSGTITAEQGLGILGAWLQTEIKKSITERKIVQELAPATIARKNRTVDGGTDDPTTALVDTGRLINAIQWEVIARGEG